MKVYKEKYKHKYNNSVYDDNGTYVSPIDDDYEYWKYKQEERNNPLSDDYCKYDNE